jgi:hypothetical protein
VCVYQRYKIMQELYKAITVTLLFFFVLICFAVCFALRSNLFYYASFCSVFFTVNLS